MIDEEFVDKDGNYWYPRALRKRAVDANYELYLAMCDLQQCYAAMKEVEERNGPGEVQ